MFFLALYENLYKTAIISIFMLRGVSNIVPIILLTVIIVATMTATLPWVSESIEHSKITSEISTVKLQLGECNSKLLETVRTGTASRCYIAASKGKLTAQVDGIYYAVSSSQKICDPTRDWIEFDTQKHLWLLCTDGYTQQYRWSFPKETKIIGSSVSGDILKYNTPPPVKNIIFSDNVQFRTITAQVAFDYVEGQSGQIIDITRKEFRPENITLSVYIH